MADVGPQSLWSILDGMRGSVHARGLQAVMAEARRRGLDVTLEEVRQVLPGLAADGSVDAYQYVPGWVVGFAAQLARQFHPSSVLDPWAGLGLVLLPVAEATGAREAIGLTLNETDHSVAKALDKGEKVRWELGDPFAWLSGCRTQFDLVVSSPPFGLRWQKGRSPAMDAMEESGAS
jgi:hypothetical protein